jgi:hypothetical protein
MATPRVLIGSKFRLYRSDGTTNANRFDNGFVCLAVDLGYKRTTDFEDLTLNDCDNPAATAQQSSTPRQLKAEVNWGGTLDAKKIQPVEADWEAQTLQEWRIIYDETNANGGETHTFFAYIEELDVKKDKGGAANVTCKLKVQGVPVRALVA